MKHWNLLWLWAAHFAANCNVVWSVVWRTAAPLDQRLVRQPLQRSGLTVVRNRRTKALLSTLHYRGGAVEQNESEDDDDVDDQDDDEEDASDEKVEQEAEQLAFQKTESFQHLSSIWKRTKTLAQKHGSDIVLILMAIFIVRQVWTSLSSPAPSSVLDSSENESTMTFFKFAIIIGLGLALAQSRISSVAAVLAARAAGVPPLLSLGLYLVAQPQSVYIPKVSQNYAFEILNRKYNQDVKALSKVMSEHNPSFWNITNSFMRFLSPNSPKQENDMNGPVIVLEMTLDSSLSQLDKFRDQINFLLSVTTRNSAGAAAGAAEEEHEQPIDSTDVPPNLEIVVVLESSGGSFIQYSLLAQQFLRLRNDAKITLTVCVDKIAASGGYMLACTSTPGHLFAAPHATVGSIGVVASSLNFYEALNNYGVASLTFRSCSAKAPLTATGEVTREGIEWVQHVVNDTHQAFQKHVCHCRPALEARIDELASGHIWLGCDAAKLGLVDRCTTSDEYLHEQMRNGTRVLKLVGVDNAKKHSLFGQPSMALEGKANGLRELFDQARRALQACLSQNGVNTVSLSV